MYQKQNGRVEASVILVQEERRGGLGAWTLEGGAGGACGRHMCGMCMARPL